MSSPAIDMLKTTYAEWTEHKAPRLGAALAFYTLFSLAPLLLIAVWVVRQVVGDQAPQQIMSQIQGVVGPAAAQGIATVLSNQNTPPSSNVLAAVAGFVTLFIGATGLFGQLQDALNTVWEVEERPEWGWGSLIKDRFVSFAMVLGCAFLLLVSMVLTTAVSAAVHYMGNVLPVPGWVLEVGNMVVSFLMVMALFAVIYRVLPDVEIAWGDVWIGAAITSLLFTLGKFALGLYLAKSSVASVYGAAGSVVVLILWVYYASQILFFGAEFTRVYANRYGSRLHPTPQAVPVTEVDQAREGMPSEKRLEQATEAHDRRVQNRRAPAPPPER